MHTERDDQFVTQVNWVHCVKIEITIKKRKGKNRSYVLIYM